MKKLLSCLFLIIALPVSADTFGGRADVARFVTEMAEQHGFAREPLQILFARTKPVDQVIRLIMPPKDPGVRSWQAYRSRFIEPKRIAAGRRFMREHAAALAQAEARWGVPREVVAAIIGVETVYGRNQGNFVSFAALATLAFDYPPRAELFRRELAELLLLAREEKKDPLSYKGSYAGALGLPQFLPSSWRRYAVDFDGNGRIDLGTSPVDAIGSVANFLAEHGWQRDQPIADRVIAAGDGIPAALAAGIAPTRTAQEWVTQNLSLRKVGSGDTAVEDFPPLAATLVDLVTPDAATEYRLGYQNFYVITRYNRSSFYASSVMDLAAELRPGSQ
jgi:membrane-bound lytic murein transglycosylase B